MGKTCGRGHVGADRARVARLATRRRGRAFQEQAFSSGSVRYVLNGHWTSDSRFHRPQDCWHQLVGGVPWYEDLHSRATVDKALHRREELQERVLGPGDLLLSKDDRRIFGHEGAAFNEFSIVRSKVPFVLGGAGDVRPLTTWWSLANSWHFRTLRVEESAADR